MTALDRFRASCVQGVKITAVRSMSEVRRMEVAERIGRRSEGFVVGEGCDSRKRGVAVMFIDVTLCSTPSRGVTRPEMTILISFRASCVQGVKITAKRKCRSRHESRGARVSLLTKAMMVGSEELQ